MAYSLALLLILIVSSVQGYHNSSSYGRYDHSNRVSKEEHLSQFKAQEFDKVFRMYRADFNGRREPRFVSFQTKDDNIEVEIDFAIPFLSIPVKRSLSGAMGTFQNVIKGIPMANVNVGALLLTGFVIVGGAMIGGISRLVNGGSFLEVVGNGLPWLRNKKQRHDDDDEGPLSGINWMKILQQIDNALLKYDFDTAACAKRTVCWYIKESSANLKEGKASNLDHVISGLSRSDWALQLISNTAWHHAVSVATSGHSCESTFSHCKLSQKHLEALTKKLNLI